MNVVEIIVGVLIGLLSIVIIAIVLMQQGRRAGISGAIAGGADTFLAKGKARTLDAKLPRWTRYLAILFVVLVLVANFISLRK